MDIGRQTNSSGSKVQDTLAHPPGEAQNTDSESQEKYTGPVSRPRRVEWVLYGNEMVKLSEKFQSLAKQRIAGAVQRFEANARRTTELLGVRAEAKLRGFLAHAQASTKDRWLHFGTHLATLGEKIQAIAIGPDDDESEHSNRSMPKPEVRN
jgi:hypothetical protein